MRILIVDDSSSDRELLVYALQEHFMAEAKFREASSLADAQAYLARGGTDAIILDLQLPDSSGLDTFLRVHTAYPHIPIVVVSNTRSLELAKKMIQLGAEDYVYKAYVDTTTLFQRVVFAIVRNQRNQRRLMSSDTPDEVEMENCPDTIPAVKMTQEKS